MNVTILYYTSNREDEAFEKKIRENILKNSNGLPIVSVSQKPIDFGHNICVGEHKCSYYNEFRQIQIGLREIKTKWVLVAEADVLYPPEYFQFEPTDDYDCYRYHPVYVNFRDKKPKTFYLKGYSDGAQIMHREKWLERINKYIGEEGWDYDGYFTTRKIVIETDPNKVWGKAPVITFKTRRGVSYGTGYDQVKLLELPYWGTIQDVIKKYL